MNKTLICLLLTSLGASLRADVVPAPLFTDNAVLQRDKPIPVWGTADAGEKVSVTFAGQTVSVTADDSGKWRVDLAAQAASAKPAELVIKGKNTVTLANIVVGEVWLASGQSNMEFTVNRTYDTAIDVPASARFPLIRHVRIERKVADAPIATATGAWKVASSNATGGFSAVGYYFAKDLYEVLHVPVGIVHSSYGGTPVEAWMNPDAYKAVPAEGGRVIDQWAAVLKDYPRKKAQWDQKVAAWEKKRDAAQAAGTPFTVRRPEDPAGPGHKNTPSGLYNGMINPLVPYAIRGAIWYQGEANTSRHADYHALFSAMITGWRAQFGQGDFPFYWVQLANHSRLQPEGDPRRIGTNWAFLREAQTKTLALPNTGQAVTIDIGDRGDVHPRNKRDVGRRLARVALNRTYKQKIADSGPVMKTAERDGAGFKVTFTEVSDGLISPLNELSGFELAGEDKVFKPARAHIDGESVIVTSAEVAEPVAVRYAWSDAPVAGLFNTQGLPAVPFRSDNW